MHGWVFVVSLESKVHNFFQFTCLPGEGGEDVMGNWKTLVVLGCDLKTVDLNLFHELTLVF